MAEELPWYHEGLSFTCSQCGDCCTGAPGYVWVNNEEIAALAAMVVQLTTMVEREESAAQADQVMVVREVKEETGNSLWVLTRFQMVALVVLEAPAAPAVQVVLQMVTAVMADLVEKAALLMVEAVEKDIMPLQHLMMVFL